MAQLEATNDQTSVMLILTKALLASQGRDAKAARELAEVVEDFNVTAPDLARKLKDFGDHFGS